MKIVVIGGSGLIGSKLVDKLRQAGHDPLAASPESGVDTLTGEGLAESARGRPRSSQPSSENDMDGFADDLAAVIETEVVKVG